MNSAWSDPLESQYEMTKCKTASIEKIFDLVDN